MDALRLEIDAHVITQLGDELITDPGQALLELVKNSYDADASYCHVTIVPGHKETFSLPPITEETGADAEGNTALQKAKTKAQDNTPTAQLHRKIDTIGSIRVEDDGSGMDLETVKRGWLTISLSPKRAFKEAGKVTEIHKRTPLGDKGLGRIGTLKLGSIIVIETHTNDTDPGLRVVFSWDDCKSGVTLGRVPIVVDDNLPPRTKGTVLTIYGLKDLSFWTSTDRVKKLGQQMSTLLSPFKPFSDFDVTLKCGSYCNIEEVGDYLNIAKGQYEVIWLREKTPAKKPEQESYLFQVNGRMKTSLFKGKDAGSFDKYVSKDNGKSFLKFLTSYKRTKPFNLKASEKEWFVEFESKKKDQDLAEFIDLNTCADPGPFLGEIYDLDFTDDNASTLEQPEFLKDHVGVFVYRDNFRIRMGDDWLGLGMGQTQGRSYYGLRPGNALGWIAISAAENQQLIEKSDREGFVDNRARRGFELLARKFRMQINDTIAECRRAYVKYITECQNKEADEAPDYGSDDARRVLNRGASVAEDLVGSLDDQSEIAAELNSALKGFDAAIKSKNMVALGKALPKLNSIATRAASRARKATKLKETVRMLPHAAKTLGEYMDSERSEFAELYATAALGLSAESLSHEIADVVESLTNSLADIKNLAQARGWINTKLSEYIRNAQNSGGDVATRVRFLDPMLRKSRAIREKIDVATLLRDFKRHKISVCEEKKIKFQINESTKDLELRANRGRIIQVLDNLFRNSQYWLTHSPKSTTDRIFTIDVKPPHLIVYDNGPGVDDVIAARIFDAFVSGKPPGEGHGLGLFISRQLLSAEKSEIALLPEINQFGRRYKFRIDLAGALSK